jgi:hypothetical protein
MANSRGGITVDISPEIYEKIKAICDPKGSDYKFYVNKVLAKHFEAKERKVKDYALRPQSKYKVYDKDPWVSTKGGTKA